MATITITYNGREEAPKKILEGILATGFFSVEEKDLVKYDPKFVLMVKKAQAQKGGTRLTSKKQIKSYFEKLHAAY